METLEVLMDANLITNWLVERNAFGYVVAVQYIRHSPFTYTPPEDITIEADGPTFPEAVRSVFLKLMEARR